MADMGLAVDPLNSNRGMYAGGDPVNGIDPDGHQIQIAGTSHCGACTNMGPGISTAEIESENQAADAAANPYGNGVPEPGVQATNDIDLLMGLTGLARGVVSVSMKRLLGSRAAALRLYGSAAMSKQFMKSVGQQNAFRLQARASLDELPAGRARRFLGSVSLITKTKGKGGFQGFKYGGRSVASRDFKYLTSSRGFVTRKGKQAGELISRKGNLQVLRRRDKQGGWSVQIQKLGYVNGKRKFVNVQKIKYRKDKYLRAHR